MPLWGFVTVSFNIGYPYFTDVGDALYRVAHRRDPRTSIRLLQGGSRWAVRIFQPGLQADLESIPYRGLITDASNTVMAVRLGGEEERARGLVREVVEELGRYPWEVNDWPRFTKATGASAEQMVGAWVSLLGEIPPVGLSRATSELDLASYRRCIRDLHAYLRGLRVAFPGERLPEALQGASGSIRLLFDDGMLEHLRVTARAAGELLHHRRGLQGGNGGAGGEAARVQEELDRLFFSLEEGGRKA